MSSSKLLVITSIFWICLDILVLKSVWIKQNYSFLILFGQLIILAIFRHDTPIQLTTEKEMKKLLIETLILFFLLLLAFAGSEFIKSKNGSKVASILFKYVTIFFTVVALNVVENKIDS